MIDSFGGREHHLFGSIAAVLRVDGDTLQILGGTTFGLGGRATALATVELPSDASAAVGVAPQGPYNLATLQVSCRNTAEALRLNLTAVRTIGGILPWRISGRRLEEEARKLDAVLQQRQAHS